MGQFEQLDQLLETQDGMLRTAQVVSAGISKPVFYDYVHSRELERVAHGIYLSKDAWVDAMYLLHLRVEQAVFSHETALFFHDLTDRAPFFRLPNRSFAAASIQKSITPSFEKSLTTRLTGRESV